MLRIIFASLVITGCGQIKSLSRADHLNPEERIEYLILRALEPQAAAQYLTLGSSSARQEYLNWFWNNRNESEHRLFRERAEKARELFGKLDLLGDERIKVYILYGPPRREEFAPRVVENETMGLFVNPAEIWTYDSLGLQFDFVKKGVGFKQVGYTRFGSAWFPWAFEPVDYGKPAPKPVIDAKPLEVQIALYRLGQHQDTVEVELHYGVRLPRPGAREGDGPLLYFEFRFESRRYGIFSRSGWFGASIDTNEQMVVGREIFHLPADLYRVKVGVVNVDGTVAGERQADLNLIDYVRRSQPASDIVFYSLVDNVFQSPQFSRPEWRRVVPLVPPHIRSGSTFYVLFEIYNLATDSLNRYRAEITYEIMDLVSRQQAVIPTPTRFITGVGTTGVAQERIHTMDLIPGSYLLIARVRDLNRDREISLTAQFWILPVDKQ